MKRRHREDTALDELRRIEAEGVSPECAGRVAELLGTGSQRVVMRAAQLARDNAEAAVAPDLARAFSRLLGAAKSDPGCLAKAAVLEALNALDDDDAAPFIAGVDYRQMEPVWGTTVDTAGNVRGLSLRALVRIAHPEDVFWSVTLLHDPAVEARRHAVAAMLDRGGESAEAVLRMKVLGGDAEGEVIADALAALMQLEPDRAAPFVAAFLDRDDETLAEAAALALGESRSEAGWATLRERWEATVLEDQRERLLLPMGLHRSDASNAFLLGVVAEAGGRLPAAAVRALAIRRDDDALRDGVERIIARRGDPALVAVYEQAFPARAGLNGAQ